MITNVVVAAALAVAPAVPSWEIVPLPPDPGNLVATTALSANDIWTAGFTLSQRIVDGRPVVTFQPQVRHWNGRTWSPVPTPPLPDGRTGRLNAIAASARDQVWAVGDSWGTDGTRSLIERWDGTAWTHVPADDLPGVNQNLYGVAAISPADAWAVGSTADVEHTGPMAQHWDGVRWTRVPLPADLGDAGLSAVAAGGPSDVWAAGYSMAGELVEPLVLRWDGVAWHRVALPSTTELGLARLTAITVSHGQVWAGGESTVGGAFNRKPLAVHVTARGAAIERTPDERGQLNAVTTVGRDVWAVGYRYDEEGEPHAYALRRAPGGQWSRAAAPEAPGATLSSITAVPNTRTLWTTGAMDGPDGPTPLIARFP